MYMYQHTYTHIEPTLRKLEMNDNLQAKQQRAVTTYNNQVVTIYIVEINPNFLTSELLPGSCGERYFKTNLRLTILVNAVMYFLWNYDV